MDIGAKLGLQELLAYARNVDASRIVIGYIDTVMKAQDKTVNSLQVGLRKGKGEADVTESLGARNERYAVDFRREAYQDATYGYGLQEHLIPKAKIFVSHQMADPFEIILKKTSKHMNKHYAHRAAAMLGVQALDGSAHAMALIKDGQDFYYFDPNHGLYAYNSSVTLPLPLHHSAPQPYYYAHFVIEKKCDVAQANRQQNHTREKSSC
ncbi:MAG: C58 family peptidase [Planctomycetaceae bacterium]|nr:C58 family peptidase [Planctomycetaceae bacterium]